MAAPIEMPFWLRTRVGPGNRVLDGVQTCPWEEAIFLEKGVSRCKVHGHSAVHKTAEPIEMPFGLWVRIGRRNHVLDGGPPLLREVATATNFGTHFAITGFVGYNFGWMIASNTLFRSRWVFEVKLYLMKT